METKNSFLFSPEDADRKFSTFPDPNETGLAGDGETRLSVVHRSLEDGAFIYIVHYLNRFMDQYNGYVRFARPFLITEGYNGPVSYVPVHGGITFCEEMEDGTIVYGFDTCHCDDIPWGIGAGPRRSNKRDMEWLLAECRKMLHGLLELQTFEKAYLEASSGDRIEIAQKYAERMYEEHEAPGEFNMGMFFEIMMQAEEKREEEKFCCCKHPDDYVLQAFRSNSGICEGCEKVVKIADYPEVAEILKEIRGEDDAE